MIANLDPTIRFSDRVGNYVKHRPRYPSEIIPYLADEGVLRGAGVVADVGSGTGFSAELFLEAGHLVYGVEPNVAMRDAGELHLAQHDRFISTAGTAEATTLDGASVDIVVAGQAFHWFDPSKTRVEFQRILKPGGTVVLMWNERAIHAAPFDSAYELLLREFGTDYLQVTHRMVDQDSLAAFFGNGGPRVATFPNEQALDLEGLRGRLLSSSYVPKENHPAFMPMIERLEQIFSAHQDGGRVRMQYACNVYWGRLAL